MKRVLSSAILGLTLSLSLPAQTALEAATLTRLLNEFLAGASRNDAAVHDRFWADDVIYTGSGGRRRGKVEIMRDVRAAPAPKPGDPTTVYTAEDIRIQQYDKAAIVAFRLVGTTQKGDGKTEVANFLNSGTFIKRNGNWQVVNWQATKVPLPEAEATIKDKQDVTAAEANFHQAIFAADVKKLESLTDETFIWTKPGGDQVTRSRLLDDLGSGRLKYATLETNNVTVVVYGDTAIVRGASPRQRSSIPGSPGTGDPPSLDAFYTLTFVRRGGVWKAVAMHSTRLWN